MHRIVILIAATFTCVILRSPAAEAGAGTSHEARGVWLHLSDFSADAGQGKKEVRQVVERLANANFNFIMPWVLSEYAAALTDTNYQGSAPTAQWDALTKTLTDTYLEAFKAGPFKIPAVFPFKRS